MNEFEHLKIKLEDIKRATNNFSNNDVIGCGGFGNVYKGEVSHSKGRSMVAIKRLDRKYGQGDPEFLKEIMMLSHYSHKNLISLLGFCDETGEKILVYEYESNGSLDRHLSSTSLTWAQRFKICLHAAKGLSYLHDHKGTQQRVLHRDIKSANILLDCNWNAKLSDMGLSKLGPANQSHTVVFTTVVGSPGYCDPQYMTAYTLTKESDIYSFGVVLFEVLCGKLCFKKDSNHKLQILVPMWKESYEHKKLDEIIFKDLMLPMNKTALEIFADIAFQCVHESREKRPEISLVVEKLEVVLKLQRRHEMKLSKKYNDEDTIKDVKTLQNYKYPKDHTSKGKRVVTYTVADPKREGVKQKDANGSDRGRGWWWWLMVTVPRGVLTFMLSLFTSVCVTYPLVMICFGGGWRKWWFQVTMVVAAVAVGVGGGSLWWAVMVMVLGMVVVPVCLYLLTVLQEELGLHDQPLLIWVMVVAVAAVGVSSGSLWWTAVMVVFVVLVVLAGYVSWMKEPDLLELF